MGSCLASLMDWRANGTLVDEKSFKNRLEYGVLNVKVTEDEEDRSGIYRSANVTDEEHQHFYEDAYNGKNVLQQVIEKCKSSPNNKAFAYRDILTITKDYKEDPVTRKEKMWETYNMSEPLYITYQQLWERIECFGKGLVSLGIQPGQFVALYEETRWEWLTSMLALWTQHMIAVTVYANLGEDGLKYAMKESDCAAVVCNGSNVKKLLKLLEAGEFKKCIIIYLDKLPVDVAEQISEAAGKDGSEGGSSTSSCTVISWADVMEKGKASSIPVPPTITNPDELVLVMYTSGTVAEPKGVMHSIGALTHGKDKLYHRLRELLGEGKDERYVSYLPSAHIFEFICELIFLTSSSTLLCFGSARTLMDVSAKPCGDITAFQPFFLIGVPRIFETIKKAVEAKLPPVGTFKRTVFDLAYRRRRDALLKGKDIPFWNEKVFYLPRKAMGSRLLAFCSGGAPLADSTQEWVATVLGVQIAQGYGLTETVCNSTVQRTGELRCCAGQCLVGLEMMLLDTELYKHTDKPYPRGELCFRSHATFKGYYKQPELTKECMLPGGWFRTGDIGEISGESKEVKIIGRCKGLAKNLLGEYIALEQMEAIYGQHPVSIPNGVCVLVHPQRSYISLLMLTDEAKAVSFARENKISGSYPSLLREPAFEAAMIKTLQEIAKKANRKPFELVKTVRVLSDEWTPENGLVTASLKLRRSIVEDKYKDVIEELFVEK